MIKKNWHKYRLFMFFMTILLSFVSQTRANQPNDVAFNATHPWNDGQGDYRWYFEATSPAGYNQTTPGLETVADDEYTPVINSEPAIQYYINDHLGTPRWIMDHEDGSIIWPDKTSEEPYKDTPFGFPKNIEPSEGKKNLFRISGKEQVENTRLVYFNARYYSNEANLYHPPRFTSPDPSLSGNFSLGDPQSFNLFSYCSDNPLNYHDPDGKVGMAMPAKVFEKPISRFLPDSTPNFIRAVVEFLEPTPVEQFVLGGIVSPTGMVIRSTTTASAKIIDKAAKSSDELVDLFRAVGPDELSDIQKTSKFNPSPYGSEGKYFTTSGKEASAYAKEAVTNFGDAPYTIVKTQGPQSLVDATNATVTVEKGIKAIVVSNESLSKLTPEVLNFAPIP